MVKAAVDCKTITLRLAKILLNLVKSLSAMADEIFELRKLNFI